MPQEYYIVIGQNVVILLVDRSITGKVDGI
jgi:hypothetical protein